MPGTRSSSSTVAKGRLAMMACALAGPMPGKDSSSALLAVFTSIRSLLADKSMVLPRSARVDESACAAVGVGRASGAATLIPAGGCWAAVGIEEGSAVGASLLTWVSGWFWLAACSGQSGGRVAGSGAAANDSAGAGICTCAPSTNGCAWLIRAASTPASRPPAAARASPIRALGPSV